MSHPSGVSKFDGTGGPGKPSKESGSRPAPMSGLPSGRKEPMDGTRELRGSRKSQAPISNTPPSSTPSKLPAGVKRSSGLSAPKKAS